MQENHAAVRVNAALHPAGALLQAPQSLEAPTRV